MSEAISGNERDACLNAHTMSSSAKADDSDQSPASFSVTNFEPRSPVKAVNMRHWDSGLPFSRRYLTNHCVLGVFASR
jgi:hypothetical protein